LDFEEITLGNYKVKYSDSKVHDSKLAKLIHLRKDVGFEGISEFHCRAILGACWDERQYPLQYSIPQCYLEERIAFNDGVELGALSVFDNRLFRPVVPDEFKGKVGECDTNYFKIDKLYYHRRACSYDAEMLKMGREFDPLSEPTREDCLFRLGCCYEDDEQILAEYPFMPRCYKRVKDDKLDERLFDMEFVRDNAGNKICGANVAIEVNNLETDLEVGAFAALDLNNDFPANAYIQWNGVDYELKAGVTGDYCLFKKKNHVTDIAQFWDVFDIFPREYLINELSDEKIPEDLRAMAKDLF